MRGNDKVLEILVGESDEEMDDYLKNNSEFSLYVFFKEKNNMVESFFSFLSTISILKKNGYTDQFLLSKLKNKYLDFGGYKKIEEKNI